MMEGIAYVAGGVLLLLLFPLRYVYVHYLRKESHVMVVTHHYASHALLILMRRVVFAVAFFGSFIVSIGAIMHGLKMVVGV